MKTSRHRRKETEQENPVRRTESKSHHHHKRAASESRRHRDHSSKMQVEKEVNERSENQYKKELKQWEESSRRMISLLSRVVGEPKLPLDSPSNCRYAMESLCAKLCERELQHQSLERKYETLKEKHRRSKDRMTRLGNICQDLNEEIRYNREVIEDHMKQVKTREQLMMEEKLSHLEKLLEMQAEEQQKLVAERNRPVRHVPRPLHRYTSNKINIARKSDEC